MGIYIMKRNTSSIIGGGALMIQNGILSALLIITFISGLYDYNKLKKEEILDNNEAIDSALEKVDLEPKLDLNIKIDENNKIKSEKNNEIEFEEKNNNIDLEIK